MSEWADEIERYLAGFSPEEMAVSRYAFRAILAGAPAGVDELPAALGLPTPAVEAAVGRLTERGVISVEPDTRRLIGARGLSSVETDHRLSLGERQLYTWCAVDAVGIPAALRADARVESRCHHCGVPLSLELKGGAVVEAPEGLVIWAAERDLRRSLRAYT